VRRGIVAALAVLLLWAVAPATAASSLLLPGQPSITALTAPQRHRELQQQQQHRAHLQQLAAERRERRHRRYRWRTCRFGTLVDPRWTWTRYEVQQTIRCAVRHYPVSLSHAMYVADRESSFFAKARNPSSGACGIYQHLPSYWPVRVRSLARAHPRWSLAGSCYSARSNVLVAIWMAHTSGWGPWGG
jgi:soluble lytic murein transglycosylase-like protein